ncbi:MAG: VanZ family protein [Bryobacteraceae bacterium]
MTSFLLGHRTLILRLAWICALITVLVGSLLPGDSTPIEMLGALHVNDKVEHALAYLVLALLPVLHERVRHAAVIVAAVAALGVLLEFGQLYSPGRSFDTHDMIADFVGVAVGTVIGLGLRPMVSRL